MQKVLSLQDVFDETPEGQIPSPKTPVNIGSFRSYPGFMQKWVTSVVSMLNRTEVGREFLAEYGSVDDWVHFDFKRNGRVSCQRVQQLCDNLVMIPEVGPAIAEKVNALRTQVTGLWYYLLAFGDTEMNYGDNGSGGDGCEISAFDKCDDLYSEMLSGSRFGGRPIIPRNAIFKTWISACYNGNECKKVYLIAKKAKCFDHDGAGKPVCRIDGGFMDGWYRKCIGCQEDFKLDEFKEAYYVAKEEGALDLNQFMSYIYIACRTLDGFKELCEFCDEECLQIKSPKFLERIFLQEIDTFEEFAYWVTALVKNEVVPDGTMIANIFSKFDLNGPGMNAGVFFRWFEREIYPLVSDKEGWRNFLIRLKLTLRRRSRVGFGNADIKEWKNFLKRRGGLSNGPSFVGEAGIDEEGVDHDEDAVDSSCDADDDDSNYQVSDYVVADIPVDVAKRVLADGPTGASA